MEQSAGPAEAGFTLIELLIVMSVILILMTLAIPQMLKLHKQADEDLGDAVGTHHRAGGTAVQLGLSGEWVLLLAGSAGRTAGFGRTQCAGGTVDPCRPDHRAEGRVYVCLTNCSKVTVNNQDMYTSYTITAVPQAVGKTGDRGFCADENNVIKYDPAGGTNCTMPIQ